MQWRIPVERVAAPAVLFKCGFWGKPFASVSTMWLEGGGCIAHAPVYDDSACWRVAGLPQEGTIRRSFVVRLPTSASATGRSGSRRGLVPPCCSSRCADVYGPPRHPLLPRRSLRSGREFSSPSVSSTLYKVELRPGSAQERLAAGGV